MRFLLQTEGDISTIISEVSEGAGGMLPRRILSHQQLEAHATESGMVMVFVGDIEGDVNASARKALTRFADAAEDALKAEIMSLATGYRRLIREDMPSGRNLAVKAALNKVRVQERFLATLDMADQTEACELLRLSKSNPSATLRRKEDRGELIRIDKDGRPYYPLFQFDLDGGQIYPVLRELLRIRPAHWSNIRICYWLTRSHKDFGRAPAELLGQEDADILDAFRRATEPEIHG